MSSQEMQILPPQPNVTQVAMNHRLIQTNSIPQSGVLISQNQISPNSTLIHSNQFVSNPSIIENSFVRNSNLSLTTYEDLMLQSQLIQNIPSVDNASLGGQLTSPLLSQSQRRMTSLNQSSQFINSVSVSDVPSFESLNFNPVNLKPDNETSVSHQAV